MTSFANMKPSKPSAAENGLITIAGPPGVGKSTFMAGCERAIFFSCDQGLRALPVKKVDIVGWTDLTDNLKALGAEFDSGAFVEPPVVVIDTIDEAKQMLLDHIQRTDSEGQKINLTIADYGKANSKWASFCGYLSTRPYLVVALAHTKVRAGDDNISSGHTLALGDSSALALAGRSDLLMLIERAPKTFRRQLMVEFPGGGKDRTGQLPPKMELDWAKFETAWRQAIGQTNKVLSPDKIQPAKAVKQLQKEVKNESE